MEDASPLPERGQLPCHPQLPCPQCVGPVFGGLEAHFHIFWAMPSFLTFPTSHIYCQLQIQTTNPTAKLAQDSPFTCE